jgi:TonB-linked SusC/RagA family outer membrane protein
MRKIFLLLMAVVCVWGTMFAQQKTISGKVTDEKGNPVANASVIVRGTTIGTVTKADGSFSLAVPESARTLIVSAVGSDLQDISINGRTVINATLKSQDKVMSEVVITGYTTERKRNYAGAASVVTASEVKNSTLGSIDQMLQGRVPGLLSLTGSGQPGSSARVQIRGAGSISGSNTPLFILDGVPLEAGLFRGLNPDDFETVTVLKDAAATAQYGSRGANGVVVITSKRGKAGETRISFRNQVGQSTRTRGKFKMMNTTERLQFEEIIGSQNPTDPNYNFPGWKYSKKNPVYTGLPATSPAGNPFAASQARYDFIRDSIGKINEDWQSIFFRTGTFDQHELEVSGGNERTRFYLNANLYNQQGITFRSDLRRYNLRANIDNTTGRFKISASTNLDFNKSNFIESENAVALANPFAAAFLALPYQRFRDPLTDTVYTGSGLTGGNAYDRIFTSTSVTNQFKAVEALNSSLRITDWMTARTTLGIDYRQSDGSRFIKPNSFAGRQVTPGLAGSFGNSFTRYFSYTTTSGFDFARTFATKHYVTLTTLYEYFREYNDNFSFTGFGINTKLPNTPAGITPGSTSNGLVPTVAGGKPNPSALESVIGLLSYTYNSKYTLQANLRRDGSSKASPANRYITLWSLGASWLLTSENFMANLKAINYAKLRVSYGVTANNNGFPSFFGYLSPYGNTSYGGVGGIFPSALGNPTFGWEKNYGSNLGLDFGLLKDRISGTVEVYQRKTKGLFVNQQLSNTAGLNTSPSLPLNAGEVQNKGFEWDVKGVIIRTRDFEWSINLNGNYNKNKVTSLGQVNEFAQGTGIIRVGLPLGTHYIQKWGGVDPQTGSPLYYDKDGHLTTDYNQAVNLAEFGTFNPPHTGGFGTDISYKGIVISAFFSYAHGYSRFNNESFFYEYGNSPNVQFNQSEAMLNIWQKPGDVTNFQSSKYTRQFSSRDIQDASFIRFRDLTVSYPLPQTVLSRLKYVKSFLFYVKGNNLYTWTKWKGFDPEDNNNIAQYEYPVERTITVGLDITF